MSRNVLNYSDFKDRIKQYSVFYEIYITNSEWGYLRSDIYAFINSENLNKEDSLDKDIVAKIDGVKIKVCNIEDIKLKLIECI